MNTDKTNSNQRKTKSAKKHQSSSYVDIGTPQVPVRQRKIQPTKQECLSDWSHAS